MKGKRLYRWILLLMLLAGSTANEAWAQTKTVTYHVITLPFSNASTNNIPYRIEAIKKTVTQNTTDEIKLPLELKSPLMKYESYSYYTDVTQSGPTKIFPKNNSTFYTYDFTGKTPLAAGTLVSSLGSGDKKDVYVTYVWDDDHDYLKDDYGKTLDLTGNKTYNIEFRTNDGNWFYALNMNPERGNRGQAIPSGQVRKLADLCSDDPVTIIGTVQNRNIFYFKWKLTNNDPYNIILQTAHDSDDFIYKEDGYWKINKDALFYGSLKSATEVRTNWVTNEINKAYQGKSSVDSIPLTGWYRGVDPSPYGRASRDNGVLDNLYFSFTLLTHPIASYTLAASWVNVNEHDWVPNKSGQYLLMQHTPEGLPYAGPKFMDLTAADQIRFHEVRDYIYKVEAPITKTILTANFEWSDYGKDSLLIDYVPEAMKRKYTSITGTYANSDLTLERATFQDLYEHEDPDIKEIRDIWLKYSVQPSIPFEAASTSTTFANLKWYNIYVNKEENYITWYDTSGEPALNQFSTSEGASAHSKYGHDAHFAFIGDPYELKVVNRQASEKVDPAVIEYLKQGASTTDKLVSGADDTYYYKPVPKGTAFTVGNIYYTTGASDDQFQNIADEDGYHKRKYIGKVSNGSNYFEKYIHYSAVTNGTTLTRGITYYTSSSGGGAFISNGTEVANGTNYYEAKGHYVAVANGTTLTIGKTYYTLDTGAGAFTSNGTEVANGSNYYEYDEGRYVAVPNGTTLTSGTTYYTLDTGAGAFASNGNEVSNGSNYYEYDEGDYIAVPSGTRLTIGRTYYTTSAGAGKFIAEYEKANENQYWEKIPKSDWEIIFDNNTGLYAGCFRLRQFNTYDSPVTIGWDSSGKRPLNGDGSGGSTMARLSVLELPLMYYYYYIVDTSRRIAVMAKEEQITGTTLNYEAIPEIIRSPFLKGGTLTFKTYSSSNMATLTEGMTVDLSSADFKEIFTTNSELEKEYQNHIFVSYTTLTDERVALLDNDASTHSFNVLLNGKYIYYDNGTIKSVSDLADIPSGVAAENARWVLGGDDPYAMTIRNLGASQYVKVAAWEDEADLRWDSDPANASKFIIKSGSADNTYEVMAGTSVVSKYDDTLAKYIIDVAKSVDASQTYYNIGRPSDNTVKLYSNDSYATGYDVLRFQLQKIDATQVIYHLVDIARKELLTEKTRHAVGDIPVIPAQIYSPLVGYENYTYWKAAPYDAKGDETGAVKYTANERFPDSGVPTDIWITYVANDLVDMNHTTMYLLKYEQGDMFRQENGSDGLLDDPSSFTGTDAEKKAIYQAVYPYCNGDGNFFVYGENQYELQQEGAASTRTRWAWYVQSSNHDPYHVKILTRQTETYDGLERSGYFATRKFEGYDKLVTSLVWPNISGVLATEYMVLGNVGQYQLVTTPVDENDDGDYADEGEDPRHVVNSFEQYWKTYDTVKKKLLSDLLPSCEERERTDRTDGSIEVPTSPASLRERLTGTGEGQYNFHSYQKMAKAKRWNGYNAAGEKSKGWEIREHWFQTVKMGSGYFDLIPTTIDPALILLDQHGWEIMRKPLPSSPDDPTKAHKYEVLGAYDSPMVKEYIFWASASKRSGFHQYYKLDKRIGGSDFSSTSLTNLPPYGTENVMDNKGNLNDQYVTYIVKEEYATSYNPSTKVGAEFLISQGDDLAKKNEPDHKLTVGSNPGSTSQYIIDHIETPGLSDELWYVKPNVDIDTEMGYTASNHAWGDTNPNAYEDATYGTNQVAGIISNADDITKYGRFSFSNGFDPYNIQISSVGANTQYFTMGMTGAEVSEGGMVGKYGSKTVTLADKNTSPVTGNGYDNSKWAMTNQTFMAVQDAEGNMQLMPRFDHSLRMRDFVTLVTPTAEAGDEDKLKETYTLLYRPFVYNYRIIDNEGRESLRYQSGGDLAPQTPDHFKSPLAKDFKYYKGLTETAGVYRLTNIANNEITGSLAGAGLTTPSVTDENIVFVRYTYDEEADVQHILLGKWLTMKLNEKDVQYTTVSENKGIYADAATPTKPATIDNSAKTWQWKFLKNPYLAPDPYAVQLFNRNQKDMPMGSSKLDGTVAVTADASPNQYFALLSHTSNGYALAVARTKEFNNYYFLQGIGTDGTIISTSNAASVRQESGFTGATCSFSDMKSQILLTDDVENTYTYKVYTNGGVEAISDTQTQYEAQDNEFKPKLPDAIKTPLLNFDQFRYYEALTDTAYNSGKTIPNLYGLYDGEVYVRYNAYNPRVSEYKVPNERNEPGNGSDHKDPVAKGDKSNDASLRLDGKLPYNIIWYNDNMMKANGTSIECTIDQELQNDAGYSWTFAGDDPYAIKIRDKGTTTEPYKYVHETTCGTCGGTGKYPGETTCATCGGSGLSNTSDLNASATSFMLLNRDGYEYGVLAKTGDKTKMLTGYGHQLTASDTDPTKFIIFALGASKVVYHLTLTNIGSYQDIPYRHRNTGEITDPNYKTDAEGGRWNSVDGYYEDVWQSTDTIRVHGTTKRDLTNNAYNLGDDGGLFYPALDGTTPTTYYCKDVGPVSLGDELKVPTDFYRPNVNYFFVVRDIQGDDGTLSQKYKGLQINSKEMSLNEALIGKTVYVDIVYRFNTDLESNSGDDFVKSIDQNKWYTLETVIDGKTYLAQYTNAWGFELKEGRGSHYTNDFLWTPIGDPYGFQLVNRYMDVNSGDHNLGEKNRAITTIPYKTVIPKTNPVTDVATSAFENGKQIVMGNYEDAEQRVVVPGGVTRTTVAAKVNLGDITPDDIKTNSIYELLEPSNLDNAGYFRFHPVANTSEQPQVYFNPEWADDNGDDTNEYLIRLKTSAADFTFGLSAELMKPYFDRAGYVGGLTKDVYNTPANATFVAAMKADNPVLTAAQLMQVQDLVYNPANIVQLSETGYYRVHSPLGISGIDPARYVSGYTHKIESDLNGDGNESDAIPMHFYEKNSNEVRQFTDFKDGGFTYSPATRGDLTILPVERDPASIFYFQKVGNDKIPNGIADADKARYNLGTISTEGLYIKGEKGQVTITGTPPALDNPDDPNIEATGERPAAVMTATKDAATQLFIMDIGGGILLIHDNVTALGRQYLKYLSYDYSRDLKGAPTIYDMKLTNHTHTDHAKFCMQPVQDTETKGINEMGLKLNLNKGGDGYYYASFCAPYDVLLTDKDNDAAYICKVWDTEMLHLKKVGKYNTIDNDCPAEYAGSDQFVPAGTPVIIRSKNTSVTMALPTKVPSATLAENYKKTIAEGGVGNIFSGAYLEQLLPELETGSNDVYVFGLPYKGTATKHGSYSEDNAHNGQITISLPQHEESGIGFYINANYNRESKADMGSWLRNNRYVYNNKVYYRTPGGGGAAAPRRNAPTPDFIPVVFDDEDEPIDDNLSQQQRYDGRVYDLQGRCVASKQQVDDGSWKQHVRPGIYILNGRKFRK